MNSSSKKPSYAGKDVFIGIDVHKLVTSSKLSLRMRRIRLLETAEVYQLRPEFVMP